MNRPSVLEHRCSGALATGRLAFGLVYLIRADSWIPKSSCNVLRVDGYTLLLNPHEATNACGRYSGAMHPEYNSKLTHGQNCQ